MRIVRTVAIASLVVAASVVSSAQPASLKGVWRVVEVTGADGKVNAKPEPGLYIFTDRHYSITRVNQPRVALSEKPSEKEQLAAFGPFTANAGTYEIKGTQVTTRPTVAKNPNVMTGSGGSFELKMEGANTAYVISAGANGKTIVKLQRAE
jgi:hypothetical protein